MSVRHASKSVVDALPFSRSSTYVCRQCRRDVHPPQILIQQRGYASERTDGLPLAERVRRKLWKGKPPGPENVDDLYGGPGALETMFKERKERRTRSQSKNEPIEPQAPVEVSRGDAQTIDPIPQQEQKRETSTKSESPRVKRTKPRPVDPKVTEEYKQATTWEGLEMMGHVGNWKEMPYNKLDDYKPWLPLEVRKELSYTELVSLMHQAIAECHAFRASDVPYAKLSKWDSDSPLTPQVLEGATFEISDAGEIVSVDGLGALSPPPNRWRPRTEELSHEAYAALLARTEPELAPHKQRLLNTKIDTSFLNATLEVQDPLTLRILKRFTRLMNHTIPDPLLSDLASTDPTKNTIGAFLVNMAEKTKKKDPKVAELLMKDSKLAEQKNLLILGRRETPVDKEKEMGRWKVIAEELTARGLPVLGRVESRR